MRRVRRMAPLFVLPEPTRGRPWLFVVPLLLGLSALAIGLLGLFANPDHDPNDRYFFLLMLGVLALGLRGGAQAFLYLLPGKRRAALSLRVAGGLLNLAGFLLVLAAFVAYVAG